MQHFADPAFFKSPVHQISLGQYFNGLSDLASSRIFTISSRHIGRFPVDFVIRRAMCSRTIKYVRLLVLRRQTCEKCFLLLFYNIDIPFS
ncbi:unnamed protein product [Protopolystoma xenopodis]|uniref:Uncharacterized protein n=1 Tax=Protopolystoma xenopodis TaxID=117903 RepID=A0A3S5BUX4_9PLAT|nr:unnamed protein product [Protopolystoma xenopodis]